MAVRTEIAVRGNHHPIRVSRAHRNGTTGVLIAQGSSWLWVDSAGFDELVDVVDALLDDEPQLGRIERFAQTPAVRPSQWQRPNGH